MRRNLFVFLLLVLPVCLLQGQQTNEEKIDSLKQLVWNEKDNLKRLELLEYLTRYLKKPEDSVEFYLNWMISESKKLNKSEYQANALIRLTSYYLRQKPKDSVLKLAKQTIKFSDSTGNLLALLSAYINLSLLYYHHDEIKKSLSIAKKGLDIGLDALVSHKVKSKDSIKGIHKAIFGLYNRLSSCYTELKMYDSLMYYRKKAIALADSLNIEKYKYLNLYKLGYTYSLQLRYYEKGLSYLLKSYEAAKDLNYTWLKTNSAYAIATSYYYLKKTDSSEYYLLKAIEGFKLLNDYIHLTSAYYSLAILFQGKGFYDKALQYIDSSIIYDKVKKSIKGIFARKTVKISILLKKGEITTAKKVALEILNDSVNFKKIPLDLQLSVYEQLYNIENISKNYKKALFYHEKMLDFVDSLNSIQRKNKFAELEQKYQAEKKERENLQLKKEKAEQALALQRQTQRTRTLMAASGGTLLLSGVFMFFWVRLRRKNKTIRQLQRVLAHRTKGYLQKIVDFIDYIVEYIKETEATPEEIAVKVEELKSRIMTIIRAQELIMRKGGILSLDEYVGALVGEWRAMLKDRLISIRTEVEEGLNLSGSQVLPVGLILDEFVLNSSKYAFDEGHRSPEIRINARAEGGKLILEMRDNGRGGSVEEVKGSGFGLNMMRRIVEQQLKGKLLIDGSDGFYMRVEMPLEPVKDNKKEKQIKPETI